MLRVSGALGAALMLPGCLAAAIPVMAGSVLATKDVVAESRENRDGQQPAAIPAKTTLAGEAAPTVPGGSVEVGSGTGMQSPFASFAAYAMEQAFKDMSGEAVQSASLRNPGALDGERNECGNLEPAVLIDLDPKSGLVPEAGDLRADKRAANLLASLRNQGVTVGWISGRTAADAGTIRKALASSGLDPEGQDRLVLMRYPQDRKQTRRREFAEQYCIIAIAGDAQSDFDELYDYLKNPAAAAPLEALYGNGWFLTPLLLTQE
ncbi:hypothetical protein [Altererythrobacter sp.]|uniref:hypothetical protein n=2 Tax=Altererythrobacter sp. TaxID=1872480 RepID=UPI003CFD92D1